MSPPTNYRLALGYSTVILLSKTLCLTKLKALEKSSVITKNGTVAMRLHKTKHSVPHEASYENHWYHTT